MGENATEQKPRRLAVIDLDTSELVHGFEPRPALELIHGGEKKSKDKRSIHESVDWAKIGKAISDAHDVGGAASRATLDTQAGAIRDLHATVALRDAELVNQRVEHTAQVTKLLDLVTQITGTSMEKLVADAQVRVAELECGTTIKVLEYVSGSLNTFSTGPFGTMLAERLLPASSAAAAQKGAKGGEAALMRLIGKLAMDQDLAWLKEALENTAGPEDWSAITAYVAALAARKADASDEATKT